MKTIVTAAVFAVIVATGAAYVLINNFQTPSYVAFSSDGARVGDPGSNLVSF